MATIIDYALMAASAYQFARSGANRVVPPSSTGWQEDFEYYTRDQDTGFEAKVFHRGNEIVIAFTGTDEWRDWITNASAALGWIPNPLQQAAALYARVVKEKAGAQVRFTGHSLGGGLASLMGVFFDRPAVTFDQAPFKASASEANREALLSSLAASGFGDDAEPPVQAIRSTLRGFTAGSFVTRQSRVSDYSVAGEILSSELIPLNRIGTTVEVIQHGASGATSVDLHSMSLLVALRSEAFKSASMALPRLISLVLDPNLFRFDVDESERNLLDHLLRHEHGVPGSTQAPTGMLTHFATDMQRIGRAGSLATGDANLNQALIALGLQAYYVQANGFERELFAEVAGGLAFDGGALALNESLFKASAAIAQYVEAAQLSGRYSQFEAETFAATMKMRERWYLATASDRPLVASAGSAPALMFGADAPDLLEGGTRGDTLIGGRGDDVLLGGAGLDKLLGGDGRDLLSGGADADDLFGGAGNDTYLLGTADTGADTIRDREGSNRILYGEQALRLFFKNGSVWEFDGLRAQVGDDLTISRADGAGVVAVIEGWQAGDFGMRLKDAPVAPTPTYTLTGDFALLDDDPFTDGIQPVGDGFGNYVRDANVAFPDRADLFYGRESGGLIDPRGGDDRVYAKGGADWVKAGSGRDFVDAGAGDDLVETGADSDIGIGGAGSDQLFAEERIDIAAAIAAGRSGSASGQKGDWLTGGRGDDIVIGGTDDDVLFGGGEEDLIVGGAGDDTIDGDDDYIAMSFDWSVTPMSGNVYDAFYQPINIVDYAPGVGGSDTIYAGAGNDRVFGLQGDDIVYGEGGEDTLSGDDGDDMLFGGDDSDRITGDYGRYAYAANGARIAQGNDFIDGGAGNDFLYGDGGRDIVFGGAGIDYLDGDAEYLDTAHQADDYLDGGADTDVLFGRGGRDTLLGGAGDDLLFGGADDDTVDGGAGADYAEGGEGNDTLLGGADGDTLYGDGGADSLDGGAGDDRLYGGEGEDTLFGGAGADQFAGGAGNDRFADASVVDGDEIVDIERGEVIVLADVGDPSALTAWSAVRDGAAGVLIKADTADGSGLFLQGRINQLEALNPTFEFADGTAVSHSALMDQVFTTDATLIGTPIGDLLKGYAGNDTLRGLGGEDRLIGGAGEDLLEGGDGNDELIGGTGIDTLRGGAGDDIYTVDATDLVDEVAGGGFDTLVADFSAVLGANLEVLTLVGTDAIDAVGNTGANTLAGNAVANMLSGLDGDDRLLGNAGNDELVGGIGDDFLAGGAGNDEYVLSVGDGMDTIEDRAGANVVRFGVGIAVSSLAVSTYVGDDGATYLAIAYGDSGDVLAIRDGLLGPVSEYRFVDGGVVTHQDLLDTLGSLAIDGSAVNDRSIGGASADTLDGRGGDDILYGGAGDDLLSGGAGRDILYGEDGKDMLDGGTGVDVLVGGGGEDTYTLSWGTGVDRIEEDGLDASYLRLGPAIGFDNLVGKRDGNDLTLALRGNGDTAITIADYFGSVAEWNVISAAGETRLLADVLEASPWVPSDPIAAAVAAFELRIKAEYFASLGAVGFAVEGADELRSTSTLFLEAGAHTTYSSYAIRTVRQVSDAPFIQRLSASFESDTQTESSTSEWRVVATSPGSRSVAKTLAQTGANWRFVPLSEIAPAVVPSAPGIAVSRGGGDYSTTQQASLQGFWVPSASATIDVPALPVPVERVIPITNSVTHERAWLNIEVIRGGAEDNTIWASDYSVVDGGAGRDFIAVSDAPGYLLADSGRGYGRLGSLLYGNRGNDVLAGGTGNDSLIGGAGRDELSGGAGADTYARVGEGSDVITDVGDDFERYRQSYFNVATFSDLEVREVGGGRFLDNVAYAEFGLDSEVWMFFESPQVGLESVLQPLRRSLEFVREVYASLVGWDGTGEAPTYFQQTARDLHNDIERYEAEIAWEVSRYRERFVYIEPLPPLPIIAGNDHAAIEPYYGSAVWVDRVELAEKWRPGTLLMSTDEVDGEPRFLHLDHPDGDRVTIVLARAADPIGTGVELIRFADGTDLTIRQLLAFATAPRNLVGSDGDDTLLGGAAADTLAGGDGDDYLAGGGGNDTLLGGPGVDTLRGDAGNDTYYVSTGDTVTERVDEGIDTVYADVSWTLGRHLEHLTLTGSADVNVTGNGLANVLTGNAGSNWLDGKGGGDTMAGGLGDDTYVVAQGADVVIENIDQGIDTVMASVGYTLGENLENLTLTGVRAINGTGNALDNELTGNGANNRLTGGDGDDHLEGLSGTDTLLGGPGNDAYLFGLGYGTDTIVENDATLGNSDSATFLGGVAHDQIWFRRVGNDLEASIIGTDDALVLRDWYRSAARRVERIQTTDGDHTLLDTDVQVLVDAMAAFAPPASGMTTLPLEYQTALNPVIAASWQ